MILNCNVFNYYSHQLFSFPFGSMYIIKPDDLASLHSIEKLSFILSYVLFL